MECIMALLTPDNSESEQEFLERFESDPGMQAKFPDRLTRIAVARGEIAKLKEDRDDPAEIQATQPGGYSLIIPATTLEWS
jgi:hypothetical protein